MVKRYAEWLSEDYFIFHVREIAGLPSAAELCASQGGRIAQIVRGEIAQLSEMDKLDVVADIESIKDYPRLDGRRAVIARITLREPAQ